MYYATSDLHGYPLEEFLGFLGTVGFSAGDRLYIIGDVNDRNGDGGIAMYRWIMRQPNVTLIRGNHEQMLLDCDFLFDSGEAPADLSGLSEAQVKALIRWSKNGCGVTIESLLKLKREEPAELRALLEFLRATPVYQEVTAGGHRFVLVHGGIPAFSPEIRLSEAEPFDLLWTRPELDMEYWDDRLTVIGHTPTRRYGEKGKMYAARTWVDIDTGAGSGGHPMLLRLDDLKPFYVKDGEG